MGRGPTRPCPGLALGAAGIAISAARSRLKGIGWKKIKRGMVCPPREGGHLNSPLPVMSDHAKKRPSTSVNTRKTRISVI